jgi:hypothetical protein
MKTNPFLVTATMAVVLAAGVAEGIAAYPADKIMATTLSAAKKKSNAGRNSAPGQIACTVSGCHPIPVGCQPQTGYTWDGIPTGFDIVVCPPPRGRRG